ncbi:GLPGLI family protein [Dysgonomonas alginatilytica]|uniref:GLPGLI family protein n=1 Tax=Dysgonomonas alginatilytica TaxID=1605892 RepID=A0A2V3PTM7_9BACT|nr:PNGase F N-terminal domain-containing protein [Dysgonomonas alginatilytica]PXV69050.1 GLPGLI family protein [Dysgonomonas alginatilytica]
MKKSLAILLLLSLVFQIEAKGKKDFKTVRITYQTSFNNKPDSTSTTVMEISENIARISYNSTRKEQDDAVQNIYLNYTNNQETKVAKLNGGETIYTTRTFVLNDGLTPQPETEKIAGYNCKKVTASINSNRLEIWYTTELGVMGSMQPGTAIPEGIVLKIVRNGQREEKAVKVELLKEVTSLQPVLTGSQLSTPAYNYKIQQSKVIAVDVFDRQSIYFRNIPKPTDLNSTEVLQFANGSIILKKVTLPADNSGYSIFTELSQHSEGDAYDRTGSVFIVPTDRKQSFLDGLMQGKEALPQYTDKHGDKYEGMTVTNDYLPPLELMRFYTSFGVKGFNHIQVANYNWPDSVVFKQEVTDYAKALKGEVWVGAWIGNYAENGHNVSLKIKYYPNEKKEAKEIYPLFTTVNIMEMAGQAYPEGMFRNDSLTVNFKTDTDLKNAYIRYISTGHGGWGGGDEFNPKLNEIFLDNNRIIAYTPWREDCGSYRELNPASGNFSNGLSSSDLSRSGWCPGIVSYPVFVHIGDIKAGSHQLKIAIPVGDPEGSSRSYWCISGALVGDK